MQSRHSIMLSYGSREILQDVVTGELWRVTEQVEREGFEKQVTPESLSFTKLCFWQDISGESVMIIYLSENFLKAIKCRALEHKTDKIHGLFHGP